MAGEVREVFKNCDFNSCLTVSLVIYVPYPLTLLCWHQVTYASIAKGRTA